MPGLLYNWEGQFGGSDDQDNGVLGATREVVQCHACSIHDLRWRNLVPEDIFHFADKQFWKNAAIGKKDVWDAILIQCVQCLSRAGYGMPVST
eukprot:XP_001709649.1 Hypothetical protein GL50803_35265 [Giardia lamblia ATCC 50803]